MCICVHPSLHLRDTLISLSGNQKEKEMKGTLTMSFECVIILSLFLGGEMVVVHFGFQYMCVGRRPVL